MVKLSSGREIELKPLNFFQRAQIKDEALKKYNENIPVSLENCGRALMFSLDMNEAQFEKYLLDGNWQDEEIYEAGAKIFESLWVKELDKKK